MRLMARSRKWLSAFVPHRLEMKISPPWMKAPIPLRRALDRLEVEHLRHGGFNNGDLFVSFTQFEQAGISRRSILPTLTLGCELGLIEIIRPTEPTGDLRAPNAYRLTYLPAKGASAPTDEWKRVGAERTEELVQAYREIERRHSKKHSRASLRVAA